MKSIIMTTNDARELEKLGGLSVVKPIKYAPAWEQGAIIEKEGEDWKHIPPNVGKQAISTYLNPPADVGDVVFIREPWHRLTNPADGSPSDRFILAADSSVTEPMAYKWASPVSMPQDAARRFARVKNVSPLYGENVAQWEIELEAIKRETALAEEPRPVFSTADDPENASTRFTYAGDMSPEDHARMCAEIDSDRERLEQVQDRLIWIAARRVMIRDTIATPVTNPPTVNEIALEGEDRVLTDESYTLTREEHDLRLALEDAGVYTPTTEERARKRLEEITKRREEINSVHLPDGGPSDAHKALHEEDASLDQEERVIAEYFGEAAPAAAPEGSEESLTESDTAEGAEGTTEAEDDEETGSFTLGKCKYCGREWGVTLEGSKSGGYPTQRTADAAATRLCDCPEAVENRAPIVGVAFAVTVGACRYCGQMQEVGPHPSQVAADETASEVCNCPTARIERRITEQTEDARDRVQRLFGEECAELGFKPIEATGPVQLLGEVVEQIARGLISSASINIRGQCKAKLCLTTKGKIKVSRSETRSYDLEAGE